MSSCFGENNRRHPLLWILRNTWINFIWALLTSLSVLSLFELFHISESNIANNNNFLILSFVHYRQSKILFGSPLSQKSPFLLFWQFTFNLKRTWPKQNQKHSAFHSTSAIKRIFPVQKVEVIRYLVNVCLLDFIEVIHLLWVSKTTKQESIQPNWATRLLWEERRNNYNVRIKGNFIWWVGPILKTLGWIIEQIDCWTLETFGCARLTARGKAVEQAVCPACRQPTPIEIPDKVSNLKVAPASEQHLSLSSGQLVGPPAGQADPLQL